MHNPNCYPRVGGTNTFGLFPASIFRALYFPKYWQAISNQQFYPVILAILTAGRAHGFTDPYVLPEKPVGSLPGGSTDPPPITHSTDAIAGADGAVSNGVPLQKVFDDLVTTTRDRTPICTSPILVTVEDILADWGTQSVLYGPPCV